MKTRTAVFMTSDIFRAYASAENGPQMATLESDPTCPVYTKGRLERAIAQGYDAYVVSTRAQLFSHDTWWRNLIPSDHVLLADDGGSPGPRAPEVLAPWRKLYQRLELTWDEAWEDWQQARDHLPSLGIQLGRDNFKA